MRKITAFASSARKILTGVPTTTARLPFPSQSKSTAAAASALHRRTAMFGQIHPSPPLFSPAFRNARAYTDDINRSGAKSDEESDDRLPKAPINMIYEECPWLPRAPITPWSYRAPANFHNEYPRLPKEFINFDEGYGRMVDYTNLNTPWHPKAPFIFNDKYGIMVHHTTLDTFPNASADSDEEESDRMVGRRRLDDWL